MDIKSFKEFEAKEQSIELDESKASQKVVKTFWEGAAGLMKLLDGDEKNQFKSALGGIDNILSMTDLRKD